ncbi:hypothetical protein GCM10025883_45260 [Mobilicoccus caccae]|uniref:Integral membrane protein n=1 Tax=Mobilicoccus caccae TaxID=1859295 RepID=A0ABQ6IZI0_9MICO|nr:hypothetical protein GCM10025883_44510 [Mobilicoccus caccae]GMA42481.1 hypothetical protein GCM10025883_45260 [Mobilicoccus caccae]
MPFKFDGGAVTGGTHQEQLARRTGDAQWRVFGVTPWCQTQFGSLEACKRYGPDWVKLKTDDERKQYIDKVIKPSEGGDDAPTVRFVQGHDPSGRIATSLIAVLIGGGLFLVNASLAIGSVLPWTTALILLVFGVLWACLLMVGGWAGRVGSEIFLLIAGLTVLSGIILGIISAAQIINGVVIAATVSEGYLPAAVFGFATLAGALRAKTYLERVLTGGGASSGWGRLGAYLALRGLGNTARSLVGSGRGRQRQRSSQGQDQGRGRGRGTYEDDPPNDGTGGGDGDAGGGTGGGRPGIGGGPRRVLGGARRDATRPGSRPSARRPGTKGGPTRSDGDSGRPSAAPGGAPTRRPGESRRTQREETSVPEDLAYLATLTGTDGPLSPNRRRVWANPSTGGETRGTRRSSSSGGGSSSSSSAAPSARRSSSSGGGSSSSSSAAPSARRSSSSGGGSSSNRAGAQPAGERTPRPRARTGYSQPAPRRRRSGGPENPGGNER